MEFKELQLQHENLKEKLDEDAKKSQAVITKLQTQLKERGVGPRRKVWSLAERRGGPVGRCGHE